MDQSASPRFSIRGIALILGIIAVAGIIIVSILRDRIVNTPQWTVSVHGEAKVAYEPDIARINLGVQVDNAKTAQEALQKLNTEMQKVITSVESLGVTREDIHTQTYSLYPNYQYTEAEGVSTVYGYNANQQVTIKTHLASSTPDMVSKIIETASAHGVNQINGVVFEMENMETVKQEARRNAIDNARTQAKETAKALDIKLGKIVGWYENTFDTMMMNEQRATYAEGYGGGRAIIPDGQEITIGIDITYKVR